jgi:spore cortex formation protein SpoVR/YcgB (stage V sporulation)
MKYKLIVFLLLTLFLSQTLAQSKEVKETKPTIEQQKAEVEKEFKLLQQSTVESLKPLKSDGYDILMTIKELEGRLLKIQEQIKQIEAEADKKIRSLKEKYEGIK